MNLFSYPNRAEVDLDYIKIISHGFLITVLTVFLFDTLGLSQQTAVIPQLFILASFLCLAAHYTISIMNTDNIVDLLKKEPASDTAEVPANLDKETTLDNVEEAKSTMSIDNIELISFIGISGWLLFFSISAFYIGFFISVLAFVGVYIYWQTAESDLTQRIGYTVGGSVFITILTYVLLIEVLNRTLLLRVGVFNLFDFI